MKKNNSCLHAFTLAELLVVMILAGIMSTMVYYAFNTISNQFNFFQKKQDLVAHLKGFHNQLYQDIVDSHRITTSGNSCTLHFLQKRNRIYRFNDKFIERVGTDNFSDRLDLQLFSNQFLLNGMPVRTTAELVDEIILTFVIDGTEFIWHFEKRYTSWDQYSRQ